ncbi:MAG: mismatch endonuclease, patch repair protein [Methylobacteriaceae bacterium]|nr:mismatch endonuclease, patch repair protein [Methylobacteriaceae bacterium]
MRNTRTNERVLHMYQTSADVARSHRGRVPLTHTIDQSRSHILRAVRKKDTKPELAVRKLLHALGFRFRLHSRELPGSPDIVLPRHKAVIFVHGCFWHQHAGCRHANVPQSRPECWVPKLARNVERDRTSQIALKAAGWRILVLWECELRDKGWLREQLLQFLAGHRTA